MWIYSYLNNAEGGNISEFIPSGWNYMWIYSYLNNAKGGKYMWIYSNPINAEGYYILSRTVLQVFQKLIIQ